MKITAPKFCVFGLAIVLSIVCKAQSYIIEPPRLAVKWSILHLVYFYPSIQVGLEHKLFKNVNMQYDLGWVFSARLNTLGAQKLPMWNY